MREEVLKNDVLDGGFISVHELHALKIRCVQSIIHIFMFPTFLQQTDRLDRFFIITKVATYKIDNGFRLCVRFCYCGFPDTKQEQKKKSTLIE